MSGPGTGGLLGLALGDAMGAPHEGGPLGSAVWGLLGLTRPGLLRYTDDTQMALVLAEHLRDHGAVVQDDLAKEWAAAYDPRRGYGGGASKLLRRIRSGARWQEANTAYIPTGSWGNGGAMRAAPVGLAFTDPESRRRAAAAQAEITHAHPEGIEGAVLISEAAALAVRGASSDELVDTLQDLAIEPEFVKRLELLPGLLLGQPGGREVVAQLGHGVRAAESVVTAIYAFLRHRDLPFGTMLAAVIGFGGDTDTIGAMAGALWGAANGAAALPAERLAKLEDLPRLRTAGEALDRLRAGP